MNKKRLYYKPYYIKLDCVRGVSPTTPSQTICSLGRCVRGEAKETGENEGESKGKVPARLRKGTAQGRQRGQGSMQGKGLTRHFQNHNQLSPCHTKENQQQSHNHLSKIISKLMNITKIYSKNLL